MAFALPKPFGKYLLIKRIAVGGMAEIYQAKSRGAEGFQRDVVIKLILPSYSEDEAFVTMFIDEARIAARLHHANIVQIFDFDKLEDSYYIAMEFVEGRDLRKVMDRALKVGRKIPHLLAVHAAAEIAAGLKYAHTRKGEDGRPLDIIHRDVSPHNILVSFGGDVKITDFGIAKAAARSTKTRAGTVKGKCAYMSPEQARGKPLDGRSDMFAVCSILWEMLTGRRAFDGDTDFEILNNVLNQNVPPPSLFASVPRELDAIVLKGLRKEKEERYADMAALEKDLRGYGFKHAADLDELSLGPYLQELFAAEIAEGNQAEIAAAMSTPSASRAAGSAPKPAPAPVPPAAREPTGGGTLLISDDMRPTPPAAATDADAATLPLDGRPPKTMPVGMLQKELEQILDSRTEAAARAGASSDRLFRAGSASSDRLAARAAATSSSDRLGAPADADQPTMAIPVEEAERVRAAAMGAAAAASADDEVVSTGRIRIATGSRQVPAAKKPGAVVWGVMGVLLIGAVGAGGYLVHAMSGDGGAAKPAGGGTVVVAAPDVPAAAPDTGAVAAAPDPGQAQPEAKAAPATCAVEFDVTPASATVKVDGDVVPLADGKRAIAAKYKVGDEVSLVVTAPGHREHSARVILDEPKEVLVVKLDPLPKAPSESGFVTINARPWADVFFRGRKVGTTPVRSLEVPTGRQTFTLKNATTTRSVTVVVEKGRTSVPPVVDM
ncbi:MAG: protein kinase [Deltaproteobacteria bacterium]|nr:protein kinase [Deltaproteobacteria bacterium]